MIGFRRPHEYKVETPHPIFAAASVGVSPTDSMASRIRDNKSSSNSNLVVTLY